MSVSLEALRRRAKNLRKAYESGDRYAAQRIHAEVKGKGPMQHADFLHVIAREENFDSWPKLKLAAETQGLDRAGKLQRLKIALAHGHNAPVRQLLWDTPDLARGLFGLEVALYDRAAVMARLAADPGAATRLIGDRKPLHFLCFSKWHQERPELKDDMLAIADALVAQGADVNAGRPESPGSAHRLSPLYGALGHAHNMALAEWLLAHGADPNDGESLYHATELGHADGLRLLLDHGARPEGTNALPRALDFGDLAAVRLLLDHGADPNEGCANHPSGQPPLVIPALPQAARRMCDGATIRLLLDHGADPNARWQGLSAYALARVHGNAEAAEAIAAAGADTTLTPTEMLLAEAAEGRETPGQFLDPARLPEEYRGLLRAMLHLPDKLDHLQRLAALGLEWDRPDAMGVTPVQTAGWEGLPEVMAYFLRLGPDLGHVNAYGGTLLSTIIHGSQNAPDRASRDHIACLRLALDHGVALPTRAIQLAGREDVADFLAGWAKAHPGQVVAGGVA